MSSKQPAKTVEELRQLCDQKIPLLAQTVDSLTTSFCAAVNLSVTQKSQQTTQLLGEVEKAKVALREAEDELVKSLRVKTQKEGRRMAIMDSIGASKARVDELNRKVLQLKDEREKCAAIVSKQSRALLTHEENGDKNGGNKGEIQEAISWYNRVLGVHIECGRGVKFIFKNINLQDPNMEYYFTIRHANDTYTLLDCCPELDGTRELVYELNKTNGLFKFVRIMREKFQEYAKQAPHMDVLSLSLSGPDLSLSTAISPSTGISGSVGKNYGQLNDEEGSRRSKKSNRRKSSTAGLLSPRSTPSTRRSPRLKVRK